MEDIQLEIENLKCGGCETSVRMALSKVNGIKDIAVNSETGQVQFQFEGDGPFDIAEVEKKLAKMGYPKKGSGTALQKAKSYVSCAVGKLSNKK